MEVMVALAILGASLGVFISILGNSMRMRWKLQDHAKDAMAARIIAEKVGLGMDAGLEMDSSDLNIEVLPIEITARGAAPKESGPEGLGGFGESPLAGAVGLKKLEILNVAVGGVEITTVKRGGSMF